MITEELFLVDFTMKIINSTAFEVEKIMEMKIIGHSIIVDGERIQLLEHPENPDRLISIGDTFSGTGEQMRVISDDTRKSWETALVAPYDVYVGLCRTPTKN